MFELKQQVYWLVESKKKKKQTWGGEISISDRTPTECVCERRVRARAHFYYYPSSIIMSFIIEIDNNDKFVKQQQKTHFRYTKEKINK